MGSTLRTVSDRTFTHGEGLLLVGLLWATMPGSLHDQMDPYFTAINYSVEKQSFMVMALPDRQLARHGNDFATGMLMVQYGITSRWTVGVMAEGQKISGMPVAYGGIPLGTYFHLFRDDRLLNLTLYGEYEDLNGGGAVQNGSRRLWPRRPD